MLTKFSKKEHLIIFAVELKIPVIKALLCIIDPNPMQSRSELDLVTLELIKEKFPKQKRYILEIYDDIMEIIYKNKSSSLVVLYSIPDTYYRILL